MTFEEARDALLELFRQGWAFTGYPAFYQDRPATVPSGPWACAAVSYTGGGMIGMPYFHEARGRLTVEIFVPVNDGLQEIDRLVKVVTDSLLVPVPRGELWLTEVGPRGSWRDGQFQQMNVEARFSFSYVKE